MSAPTRSPTRSSRAVHSRSDRPRSSSLRVSIAPDRSATEPDYVRRNRTAWDRWAPYYTTAGRRAWADSELRWGLWGSLESELRLLAGCEAGMSAVELGCGSGAVSASLAAAGLHPVGVDFSRRQIEQAHRLQEEFGVGFRLELANAESLPYESASFDLAVSDYGVSVWSDPYRWVSEASRLLRPGGLLVFLVTSPLLTICTPTAGGAAGERLERPYFGMHSFEYESDDVVEFHLGHGEWFTLLKQSGFVVEDLIEVRPDAHAQPRYSFVSSSWARDWPSEDAWRARRL